MNVSTLVAAQGISLPVDPLPHELTTGCWLALAPDGTSLLLGTLDKHLAFWSLSLLASESEAEGLHRMLSTSKQPHGQHEKVGQSAAESKLQSVT